MADPTLFDDASETTPPDAAAAPPDADLTVTLPEAPGGDGDALYDDEAFDAIEGGAARETLFLADAMALAYRAFFSMKNATLTAPDGRDTRTLYGFATALLKLLEDEQPEHIAVVFDKLGGTPTFRDQLYDDYKAHRPPMPPEIKDNVPLIKRLVEAFDIPVLEVEGVEADDVIGTLARRAEDEGVDAVIFSADKDFRQLLSDRVSMLRPPYMGEAFDRETPETFREKYGGLEPTKFIDLLALMGDSSDNVPGVPGIGEKTAVKLIDQYGSVEALIEHAADLKGKRAREGMTDHADDARLSKELVTIRTDVPLETAEGAPLDWHTLRRTDPDLGAVDSLFDEVGFGSRLRDRVRDYAAGRARTKGAGGAGRRSHTALPADDPSLSFDFGPYEPVTALDSDAVSYTTVWERDELDAAEAVTQGAERLSFDTETTSTNSMEAELVGVSLSKEARRAVYVPTPLPDGTPTDPAIEPLRPALEDESLLKVGHNVKYDLVVMKRHGVTVRGPIFDTMVAHYLLNPEAVHKLDDVASFYLNYRPQPITDLIGTGKNALSMRDVPVEDVGPYACEDADVALRLVDKLTEELLKMDDEGRLLQIAETIEFPLVPVLADMEMAGVKVSDKVLADISDQLEATLAEQEQKIYELAGREFTIGSTKQLGEVLFNPPPTEEQVAAYQQWVQDTKDNEAGEVEGDTDAKPKTKKQLKEEAPTYGIGLDAIGKTKTGRPKTDENVLSELAQTHDLPALVLDWRKVSKLKSTYVDRLPELVHPDTGRIHTDFNQTVTATGRLSSSNPNLQNIPIRTDLGKEIRRAFVAEPGHQLMAADYAQIELRIIAHMSGDPGLVEAFQSDQDIHTATAARVFSVDYEDVDRDQRNKVKQVNYGIPYGISAFGLANRLRIKNAEAQELIDQYRASYPGVIEFLDGLLEEGRRRGYVETLLGRRRYVPQITSRNPNDRAYAERIAVNMPIQGTQADMIKLAMIAIHRRLGGEGLATRMILQVHDELVFEAPDAEVEAVTALVREEMQAALPLGDVPIVVDVGVAGNWLDAH
ncbi:DNA polymerase I [Rubrivirga sp. S365]|uniref:DNA polymerase I n=1 Tax=Rubrivirga litoralis TaxID=3075598 RepID=A0ABU3BMS8_9BACT|nr:MULTISPECIES: DNA polymerase I [unclassified Rubrivirga]MDT0630602.1 DNA polymerase I [Rubrivirga sp. F394]MDT7857685.1 DNA polymerase I [Rubrivirga sp. S365]